MELDMQLLIEVTLIWFTLNLIIGQCNEHENILFDKMVCKWCSMESFYFYESNIIIL